MNTLIPPTPGRVLWYFVGLGDESLARFNTEGFGRPDALAALVAGVHHERSVSLAGFDAKGLAFARQSVLLLQPGDEPPTDGRAYAEWMPFQKGQAAKTEKQEAVALPVDPLAHFYSPPTQRALLESSLVSGAAAHLAQNPAVAGEIATAIQKVLDTLHPARGAAVDHASAVLYPAINAAMLELQSLQPGFNHAVDRAFNHLHSAFWSEVPAPASAAAPRPTDLTVETRNYPDGTLATGVAPLPAHSPA